MSKKKVFISYSRADSDYVSGLVDALRSKGFDVWFDKNIRSGNEWDNTIEREIKNADAMVLILSDTSVQSDNVKDEMSYAMQLSKSVIPIKIEECDVPMRLARKQFIDFTQVGFDPGVNRLVDDI
ncbi:MAG: toll/interleukin-1 receptor domain-containing protein, partial [Flavobacteriaceae bacterium]|nr:toll/interleukin-1 receptor domain-containing protein [Flavobacteriaceae bacterium]